MIQGLSRLYLGVHLPLLSAERTCMLTNSGVLPDAASDRPFALVEKRRGANVVAALDARALALGLETELTLADARARVPELLVFDHDPAADRTLLDWLATGCERYTPSVAVDPPSGLVLDVTGCTHPWRGVEGLADDLALRLARHGLTARLAHAATPEAAAALAEFDQAEPGTLPLAALRTTPETRTALARAGLKTLGTVASIPDAALAARFGETMPALVDRLMARVDRRIVPRVTPPEIAVEARFAEPIGTVDAALGTIARLTAEAATALAARGGGGRAFTVALFRSDGHVARLSVETALPTRDAAVVERLLRERVGALADPLDPGFGYDLIRLGVPVVEPLVPEQIALPTLGAPPEGAAQSPVMAALIDRLSARLGRGRVRRFARVATHIPEQAVLELPAVAVRAVGGWATPEPGEPPMRPIHLFDPPQRIEAVAEIPDGPPRRFRWRRELHEVVRQEGPERIAAEWWLRTRGHEPDKGGLTRDYYRIEDARGRRYWVFRHGLYGTEKINPDWYVHGVFA